MHHNEMMALRDIFVRQNIVLGFNGSFSQSVVEELGRAIRAHMENESHSSTRITDVFAVYTEMTQNIQHYAAQHGKGEDEPIGQNSWTVLIATEGDHYLVTSCNPIQEEHVAGLQERLDAVISLDRDALRKAYKARLHEPVPDGATGAGLGFMDMARKSCRPLRYSIERDDAGNNLGKAYFTLTATL